ncbi:hypothetical protein R1flu_028550 [Riccia fluitans]|uniref:Uncharacterized protein n=1 Tax=Riccia fluitans TaxID=41844 RepID=A0ABD1XM05_9MARC
MESWGLGGLFAVDWSGTYDNLLEELATKQKAAGLKFEYRGSRRNGPRKCGGRFTTFLRRVPKIKGLGVCNEATCLDPYLAHLYSHFHEMDAKEKEASKKSSGSKPLDQKLDFAEWGNHMESLGHETSRLFEVFHMEIGNVTTEAVA